MEVKYNLREEGSKLIIEDVDDFNPEHIFECGQAFRWKKEDDGSYTTIAHGKILNVKMQDKDLILYPSNKKDFEEIWYNYFDMGRDYGKIKEKLSENKILREAIDYGYGIRILNQEVFETIISFIISANNQIPRIKNSIRKISEEYGEYIGEFKGENYYSFPDPKTLANVDLEELREKTRIGFRDKRVVESSRMIAEGRLDIEKIFKEDKSQGQEELMKLPGVGPKVSACVLLFAFEKGDSFPVDVWVKRVMEHFFLKEETPVGKIGKIGDEMFGELAGYAQQYLFYYAREEDIGK